MQILNSLSCEDLRQLPEYCAAPDGAHRPLVLIRISDNTTVASIMAAALTRKLSFQHRLLEQEGGICLAVVGPTGCLTDQFLRSLCYVLQQAAGEDGELPDILENRLVPSTFSLFRSEEKTDRSEPLPDTIGHRFGIRLSGGTSFGSGLHPSTRLAVQTLESLLTYRESFVESVLDVGCGSGILALVCARLGAHRVLAVDRDPQAVAAAGRNVEANGLRHKVRVESTAVQDIASAWHLVAANLAVSVLHVLLADLVRLVGPQGFLVLAGFQKGQGDKILARLEKQGMVLLEEREMVGWRSFLLQKNSSNRLSS